ncbi:MAG: DNA alkylation repair protein [Anaerolineales bacterium]|nr:DNA alkylation repair protein [Anaerolineales bacterium]
MPAIQLARLKQQAALLAESFGDAEGYVRGLHHLLDYYSDRARRAGQSGKPSPLIAAYNVKLPVLRLLLQSIQPLALENPQAALALCDALWEQPYLELRQMAAMLLGMIPPQPPEIIMQRLRAWMQSDLEGRLIEALLVDALARLRQEAPQIILQAIQEWLESAHTFYQQVGLRALLPLILDASFDNLPMCFRLLQPLARNAPPALRPEVLDVLGAMARRSPQETAHFLKHTLGSHQAADTAWLIRQTLNEFPEEIRTNLREIVRGL